MTADDVLLKSLVSAPRLTHAGSLADVEPASITPGGLVIGSYRARIRTAAQILEARGLLTWRQGRACRRLYRAYALGVAGAREDRGGISAWSPSGLSDAQIGAAQDFRLARQACPPASWPVVYGFAVEDRTIQDQMAELGLTSGRASGQFMQRLKAGLDAIADFYDAE